MTMNKTAFANIILIIVFIAYIPALAADQEIEASDGWNVELTPYFWAAEIDGDVTLRGRTGEANISFSDILDNLDIAFMGRMEAWKGERWGWYLDILYMDLGSDYKTPAAVISTDMDVKMSTIDLGLARRIWDNQDMSFDLLGGIRYINMDGEIDIKVGGPLAGLGLGASFDRKEDWIEPVVGGRLRWEMNDDLAAAVRFDFGGFDIGDAAALTWNLVVGIDYQIKDNMKLKAGYRIFDMDYEAGSGNNKFGVDAQFRGPIFGLTLLF